MILYSIVPANIVFQGMEEKDGRRSREIEYMGERVIVTPSGENELVIDRIISTSPKAFLNPKLQPGTIIKCELNGK